MTPEEKRALIDIEEGLKEEYAEELQRDLSSADIRLITCFGFVSERVSLWFSFLCIPIWIFKLLFGDYALHHYKSLYLGILTIGLFSLVFLLAYVRYFITLFCTKHSYQRDKDKIIASRYRKWKAKNRNSMMMMNQ